MKTQIMNMKINRKCLCILNLEYKSVRK